MGLGLMLGLCPDLLDNINRSGFVCTASIL